MSRAISLQFLLLLVLPVLSHAEMLSVKMDKGLASYGGAATIVGEHVFVSEPSGFSTPGMVHVFAKNDAGQWVETQTLSSSDSDIGDQFGQAVAGSNNYLFVSATAFNDGAGIVYVFKKTADGVWSEVATLQGDGMGAGDGFGSQVAVAGDWGVVSAPGKNGRAGAATMFHLDGDSWVEVQTVKGPKAGSDFGASIAMTDDRIAVGAPGFNESRGGVYIYEMEAGSNSWNEASLIVDLIETRKDRFGASVALEANRIAIGSPLSNQSTGRVDVYVKRGASWKRLNGVAPDVEEGQRPALGTRVAFDGHRVWASAPFDEFRRGVVLDYAGDFTDAYSIESTATREGSRFGSAIALQGDVAVVGMPGHDYGEGVAAIYERAGEQWIQSALVYRDLSSHAAVRNDRVDCAEGDANGFECSNVDLVSFIPNEELGLNRGVRLNDVWGWTDPDTGREYGLIANMESSVFIDLTTPEAPVVLGTLPRTEGSPGSTHRDIKVYKDHAFIVADGAREHGMQVFDLHRLRNVENAPVLFKPDMTYHGIASAHNIVIDEESGYAYSVGGGSGGDSCGGALHMISIQNPTSPEFVGCFMDKRTGRGGSGATHDAQCVVYDGPDAEHRGKEICIGSNGTAISIADVSDKDNPVPISTGTYPNSAYVHQGWLTDDHTFFYQNDEADENRGIVDKTRTMIWDVSDLDDPEMIGEFFGPTNSTDHNLYVHGDYMYQTNNSSGLRIIDIRNRENPVEVGFFDTTPDGKNVNGFDGTWSNYPFFESGMILLTSRREGLFIVKQRELDI